MFGQELSQASWLVSCPQHSRYVALLLTAIECILITRSWVVCDLDATSSIIGVLEQVDVRSLVESMVPGLYFGGRVEIMDVAESWEAR